MKFYNQQGTAGMARVTTDAFTIFGLLRRGDRRQHDVSVSVMCAVLPLVSLSIYMTGSDPVALVLTSGMVQSFMLPMLGVAALYFRHRRSDPRLKPRPVWNGLLWISCFGLLLAGIATAYNQITEIMSAF